MRQAESDNEPPGVPWVVADACEVSELAKAGVDKADVVAAVTGDDEDNLVDLAAGQAGVRRAPRRRPGEQPEEPVDVQRDVGRRRVRCRRRTCSPPSSRRRCRSAASCACSPSRAGRAGLVEVTLAAGSPAIDKEIVELGFPRDSTVVAILRQDHVVVPRGDTPLLEGDEVLVLVTPESEDAVRQLLIGH